MEDEPWDLPSGVQPWIESTAAGTIVAVERQGRWRPHWRMAIKGAAGEREFLLRGPRDPDLVSGSRFLSYFSIAREARVLDALQGSGLPVPRMYGFHESSETILMEWVDGANDFDETPEGERDSAVGDYFVKLAQLHDLSLDALPLSGIDHPNNDQELALGKFTLQEADYLAARPHLRHPEPLLEYGRWWLHHNRPTAPTRPSLIQGDTGPGQFLHAAGRVTALIDWELAHIGNPMLDLGNARMRNLLYPMGDINPYIDVYASASNRGVDKTAIQYYTVMSMLLSPIGMALTVQRPSARIPSMIPRFGWDVTLRKGLCQALAEIMGLVLELPALDISAGEPAVLTSYLTDHLRTICQPIATDAEQSYQLRSAVGLAEAVELAEVAAPSLAQADLDDMAELLGSRPSNRDEGLRELARAVEDRPGTIGDALIPAFYRMECRREHLLRPLMVAQTSGDLLPLPS